MDEQTRLLDRISGEAFGIMPQAIGRYFAGNDPQNVAMLERLMTEGKSPAALAKLEANANRAAAAMELGNRRMQARAGLSVTLHNSADATVTSVQRPARPATRTAPPTPQKPAKTTPERLVDEWYPLNDRASWERPKQPPKPNSEDRTAQLWDRFYGKHESAPLNDRDQQMWDRLHTPKQPSPVPSDAASQRFAFGEQHVEQTTTPEADALYNRAFGRTSANTTAQLSNTDESLYRKFYPQR